MQRYHTPFSIFIFKDGLQVSQHLSIAAARIGEDLNLFQILTESEQPLSAEELATKTGAATLLLSKLCIYLVVLLYY